MKCQSKWAGGSVLGMGICYGLDGAEIEYRWGRNFPHPSRPVLGLTQSHIQWVQGHSRGESGRNVALTTHPYLALRLKNCSTTLLFPL